MLFYVSCCLPAGCFFFCQAEDGIRDHCVTGVQTCALPISLLDGVLWVHGSGASWRAVARGAVRAVADGLRSLQQMAERGSLAANSRAALVPAVTPYLISQDKSVAIGLDPALTLLTPVGLGAALAVAIFGLN